MSTNLHPLFADIFMTFPGAPSRVRGDHTGLHATLQPAPMPDADTIDLADCAQEGVTQPTPTLSRADIARRITFKFSGERMTHFERTEAVMGLCLAGMTDPSLNHHEQERYRMAFAAFTRRVA